MRMQNTTTLTVGLLTVLTTLGAFDAVLVENKNILTRLEEPPSMPETMTASNRSAPAILPKEGTRKTGGPNVLEVLAVEQFNFVESQRERSLLEQIIPSDVATTQSKILVKDGDRTGLIAWVDSPQVKIYFLALKEALHSTFSPQMRDLVDETQKREGKPPRNLLTFLDPAINEERIVFIRVRDRLYEFHVAEDKDDMIFDLIETLTN